MINGRLVESTIVDLAYIYSGLFPSKFNISIFTIFTLLNLFNLLAKSNFGAKNLKFLNINTYKALQLPYFKLVKTQVQYIEINKKQMLI